VGTIPDAGRIVAAAEQQEAETETGCPTLQNSLYRISFSREQWARVQKSRTKWLAGVGSAADALVSAVDPEVFGVTYGFSLEDAVNNVPEPLVHFPTFKSMAQRYGLQLVEEPVSLKDIVARALAAAQRGQADVGRLRRIYFYKGGMDAQNHAEQEPLQYYSTFTFRKVDAPGGGTLSCRALTEALSELQRVEQSTPRLPTSEEDVVVLDEPMPPS